jgi:hypothetical protein
MSIPHDPSGWFGLLVQLLLFLVPPVLIVRLVNTIFAHSICLSGQRISNEAPFTIGYRFAIQNNEDVPLTGKRTLAIQILDPDGGFLEKETPDVYAGCNAILPGMDKDLKIWRITFEEMPAYETWTIQCRVNQHSRNVRVSIEQAEPTQEEVSSSKKEGDRLKNFLSGPLRLSHRQLTLYADQMSVFEGRRTTPEWGWATTAVVLALAAYCVAIYFSVYKKYGGLRYEIDGTAAILIVVFGWALWRLTRRPAPSISQGFWNTSELPESRPAGIEELGPEL